MEMARLLLIALALAASTAPLSAQELLVDPEVEEAEFLWQPPPAIAEARPPATRTVRRAGVRQYANLDRMPNMYGDFLGSPMQFLPSDTQVPAPIDIPFGAARSFKIGENTRPIPTDRVYFNYSHFHNALTVQQLGPGFPNALGDANIDRFTLGLEKTFFDGEASLDFRMPFVSEFTATDNDNYAVTTGNVGDLSVFYKHLLYIDDMVAIAGGMGIGFPTGDDVDFVVFSQQYTLHNNAYHLIPYVGAAIVPNDYWFFQGYMQIDFAATSSEFESRGQFGETQGELTEQHLFQASLSGGYWLTDNPDAYYLQGIAALMELHYTTTINDADVLSTGAGTVGNLFNRVDIINLTSGLHFQIGPWSNFRVGCAVPLNTSGENRQFDAEVQAQLNRYF